MTSVGCFHSQLYLSSSIESSSPSVDLSRPICLSHCVSVSLCICLTVSQSLFCLSVFDSLSLSLCLSVSRSVCVSLSPCILCLTSLSRCAVCLSVCKRVTSLNRSTGEWPERSRRSAPTRGNNPRFGYKLSIERTLSIFSRPKEWKSSSYLTFMV